MIRTPTAPGPKGRYPGNIMRHFRADPLGYLTGVQRRYGDVVTFYSNLQRYFIISDPDLIKEVLVTQADKFSKGPALQRAKSTLGDGLLTSEGQKHRTQRKLMQPAFHASFVKTYAAAMQAAADVSVRELTPGSTVDIHQAMMNLTLNVAGRTLFGTSIEAQTAAISRAMATTIGMFRRALYPWGPWLEKLPLQSNKRFHAAKRELREIIAGIIQQRRAALGSNGADHDGPIDVLGLLLAARDDESHAGMDDQQLFDECFTLLAAGHETTANAMTFLWYLLGEHPEIADRLRVDLQTGAPLEQIPLLRNIVSETLRLYPPAWSMARQAQADVTLGGYRIPRKATLLIAPWVVHRDPRWWTEPERFDPDRWLTAKPPRYAFIPFGGGPRQCIGDSFAWLELSILAATLAGQRRFEPLPNSTITLVPTITLRPRDPVLMRVSAVD
jgi:cytochrome P450